MLRIGTPARGSIVVPAAWPAVALLVFVSLAAAQGTGPGIQIRTPQPNAVFEGTVAVSVETAQAPSGAILQLRFNGMPMAGLKAVNANTYEWPSASVWDGPGILSATLFDKGRAIAAAEVAVRVANAGARVRMASPDAGRVAEGLVPWIVEAEHTDGIGGITFILDGEILQARGNTLTFDTRRLANGPHELFNGVYSNAKGAPAVGMLHRTIEVQNGHSVRELRLGWSRIFLQRGEAETLSARLLYTDGSSDSNPDGVTCAVENAQVASVESPLRIKGLETGVTTVRCRLGELEAQAHVEVRSKKDFPHFARDGAVLTAYDPDRSILVRTVFGLETEQIGRSPQLGRAAQAAGINALTDHFYRNPVDHGHTSLEQWQASWTPWWQAKIRLATELNMSLFLAGDDIARSVEELNDSISNPWSAEAIRFALAQARDSKRSIALDVIDEVNFIWGDTPNPSDGRWTKLNPALGDDAIVRLSNIVRSVENGIPVSWPVAGLADREVVRNWMGNPKLSDYTSTYWTVLDWRWAYPQSPSLSQLKTNLDRTILGRRAFQQLDKPSLLLTGFAGTQYTKKVPGGEYLPGEDLLQSPPMPPEAVSAQVLYAIAMGQAGVRVYHLDTPHWKNERAKARTNQGDLQTGSDPFLVGQPRWEAMSTAFNLLRHLEPFLLQPEHHAPDLGKHVAAGVRKGDLGRVLIAVNFSGVAEKVNLPIAPYRYETAKTATEYHVLASRAWSSTFSLDSPERSVELQPGEAMVVLFTSEDPPLAKGWTGSSPSNRPNERKGRSAE